MKTKFTPVFCLRSDIGDVGVWSRAGNSFAASLLGIVNARVSYPSEVNFEVNESLLERLEKKELSPRLKLNLRSGWVVDERSGPQPSDLLEDFKQEYPREWRRIKKVSDWLISLPAGNLHQAGFSLDMWEEIGQG